MSRFLYVVRDSLGKKIGGSEEASSSDELVSRLQAKNLVVINVIPESTETTETLRLRTTEKQLRFRHYRITGNDLVLFCRQLATLLGAGVTILKSLDIISKQIASRKFYNVIKELEKSMEQGASLHEAMSKHTKVFSELWVNLAESGEASGNLASVLSRLASYLERDAAFRRKLISSLIYPFILIIFGMGALLFLTIRIIPSFADLFKGFNITLPLLTRILVAVSNFIRKGVAIMFIIIIVGFFVFRNYIKTKGGRKRFENFQFKLPVFGEFFRALIVERFSSEMSTLIESGVPLLYSLEITEHSVDNMIMADIVRRIKEDVREGRSFSNTLTKSEFFEPMVVQMVAIGEEIGELPQMLKRINSFYQEYVETFLARFTSIFEPIVLVFMGLIIGTMVIGMFLPIFQIATIR